MNKLKPGKTGPYGLKVVNSDEQLEYGLMKAEMSLNMRSYTDIETNKKEGIRAKAKKITLKREQLWVHGRLGLIIDGTAHDIRKITMRRKKLHEVGYDSYMIFVNTSLDIALQQNSERSRKLLDEVIVRTWQEVQSIKQGLANMFSNGFVEIINNRAGEDVYRKAFSEIGKIMKRPPSKPAAKMWIARELEQKKR
jgi:predicted kinase